MAFFHWLSELEELPRYILGRCLLLACLLLGCALVLLVRAGAYTLYSAPLHAFAQQTLSTALVVLSAGLFGSALLEDILGHRP